MKSAEPSTLYPVWHELGLFERSVNQSTCTWHHTSQITHHRQPNLAIYHVAGRVEQSGTALEHCIPGFDVWTSGSIMWQRLSALSVYSFSGLGVLL